MNSIILVVLIFISVLLALTWLVNIHAAEVKPTANGGEEDDLLRYKDRFVWIFGWSLHKDEDVREIESILETAAKSGFNGAVL